MLNKYNVCENHTKAQVTIDKDEKAYTTDYTLLVPKISEPTLAYLDSIKTDLLKDVTISKAEILDESKLSLLKEYIHSEATKRQRSFMPDADEDTLCYVSDAIVRDMLGLGDIEFLLADENLEEICVNGAQFAIWVYHKKHGWLKTNLKPKSEMEIRNYSASIGRRVGRQITIQDPLLDAHLITGDRVNATLSPISSFGNTITIRKFARKPWTVVDLIKNGTLDYESTAFLWLCLQYELNLIVSGGTGSGKTSFLNSLSSFFPQNQRTISIEQTREIVLPKYLQWVPMVVREATSEGKGQVGMLELMINSLRMRPDRIIVGEVRSSDEAQVLFEAMHTGHSVYATMHAETAYESLRRLTNKPIDIPPVVLGSLHLIAVMYRDRRSGIRRLFEVVELLPTERKEDMSIRFLYKWRPFKDTISTSESSVRCFDTIKTFTRMDENTIKKDLAEKEQVLRWLVKNDVNDVDKFGAQIGEYYFDKEAFLKKLKIN